MIRALFGMIGALAMVIVAVMVIGALGGDPWKGFRRLMYKEQEITKQTAEERRQVRKITADVKSMACLSHQVWHTGWLNGDGNKTTALLVAVATKNLSERPGAKTDYCTIFTAGKAELPDLPGGSYITRAVEVVSGQSSTSGRTAQYEVGEKIAEQVEKAADYRALLPPELSQARCAIKFLRKRFGWLIWSTAGFRDTVRAGLVRELGEPVYTSPGGTEFFGRCPA